MKQAIAMVKDPEKQIYYCLERKFVALREYRAVFLFFFVVIVVNRSSCQGAELDHGISRHFITHVPHLRSGVSTLPG